MRKPPAKEQPVNPRVIAFALTLAGAFHLCASASDARAPTALESFAQSQLAEVGKAADAPNRLSGRLPTVVPAFVASTAFAAIDDASLPQQIASLPREVAPLLRHDFEAVAATPPTTGPSPEKSGCDPSYPDDRTCILPGPPFEQGCAITAERRFTVLAPDPQRLDHDQDGIGCEPFQ
jgi:hypothetical protein